jgi:hypothetical protein
VFANTSNNDQEVRSMAETLVALHSGTPALPEASLDQYCCVMSNVTSSVPLGTASDIEDNKVDNKDEIDQLDSDDEEVISNGMSNSIGMHYNHVNSVFLRPFASGWVPGMSVKVKHGHKHVQHIY